MFHQIGGSRIERSGSAPKSPHHFHPAARIIPNIESNRTAGAHDPFHLRQRLWHVRNEIQNQGRYHDVPALIAEGQFLRIAGFKPRTLITDVSPRGGDKAGGLFDADNAPGIAPAQNRR